MAPGAWFVRRITYPYLFPLLLGVRGRQILRLHREYRESQHWDPERMRQWQWQRVERLLRHAHANIPFYRRRLESIGAEPDDIRGFEDFAKIPPLTREELQTHLEELLDHAPDAVPYGIHVTSGSTGTPLRFGVDNARYTRVRAMLHRNQEWIGLSMGDRHAYLWAAFGERGVRKTFLHRIGHWAMNQLFHCVFDLTDEVLTELNAQMIRHRSRILTSFTSTLMTYADAVKRLDLPTPPFLGIISTGETLFPHQREVIEATFGCRIFDRYGNMEVGDIAHECEAHEGLHLNEERVLTEVLPDPELPGGLGDIVVTDLDNMSMPFIRYETGDLGRWHDEPTGCACGRTLRRIAEVQGRRYDIIRDRSGTAINGLVIEDIGSGAEGVAAFQCVQRSTEHLLFRIVPRPGFTEEQILENLRERSKLSIGPDRFEFSVELVDVIAPSKSGKLRQIVSEIAPPPQGDGDQSSST
jgi:phenylacetate-coenzyme A ligase PaaK-like adenylate-forming protein